MSLLEGKSAGPTDPASSRRGLREQTFRGVVVVMGTALGLRGLSMLSGIVLARLLDPVQFGLVSLCYIVLNVVSLLAPLGLGAALIKFQTDTQRAPFHVFVAVNTTGLLLFVLVLLTIDPLASLLGNPELRGILPWMALLILFDSLGRVPEALLEKEMEFVVMSRISIIGEMIHIGIAIPLALLGYGVWSLVVASIGRSMSGTVLSILWYRTRNWIRPLPWDWGLMKGLLGFGLPMVGSKAAYLFYLNADNFVVGRALGATALGYYAKAFSFTKSTVDSLHASVSRVLFPSYAKLSNDLPRLTAAYIASLRMAGSGTIPLALSLFAMASVLVPTLLGQKWLPMVPILQVLALMSVVKPMSATTASIFNALGAPVNNMKAGILVSVVMLAGIAVLLPQGTVGVAWAVVIAHIVGFAYNQYQMQSLLPEAARGMLRALASPFAGAVLMLLAMLGVRMLLPAPARELEGLGVLGAMAAVGAVVYGSYLFIFQRATVDELRQLLRTFKSR